MPCFLLIVKGGPPFYYFQVGPKVILCTSAQTNLHKLHLLRLSVLAPSVKQQSIHTVVFLLDNRQVCALNLYELSLSKCATPPPWGHL